MFRVPAQLGFSEGFMNSGIHIGLIKYSGIRSFNTLHEELISMTFMASTE